MAVAKIIPQILPSTSNIYSWRQYHVGHFQQESDQAKADIIVPKPMKSRMLVCRPIVIGRWSLFNLLLPQHCLTWAFQVFWSISIETPPFLFPAADKFSCDFLLYDGSQHERHAFKN
jgi:hypothetical protein